MKGKRRRHDPEFKARVALEALKGVKTIQQIAKDFDIHPVQVSEWKKTMVQGAASVFAPVPASPKPRTSTHSRKSLFQPLVFDAALLPYGQATSV